jgi:hypothetical protein
VTAGAAAEGPGADPTVRLERWHGSWPDDDPDAAFKAEVAASTVLDPLETLRGLSDYSGIPVGALARFVLARYATTGSEGLLHLGSATVERMWALCEEAEAACTDDARLAAYRSLAGMISWLRVPLQAPSLPGSSSVDADELDRAAAGPAAPGAAQDGSISGAPSGPDSSSSR